MQPGLHGFGAAGSWIGDLGARHQRIVRPGENWKYRHRSDADTFNSGFFAHSALSDGVCWCLKRELLLAEAVLHYCAGAYYIPGAVCDCGLQHAGSDWRVPAVGNASCHGWLSGWSGPEVHHRWDSVGSAVLWGRHLQRLGGEHVSGLWLLFILYFSKSTVDRKFEIVVLSSDITTAQLQECWLVVFLQHAVWTLWRTGRFGTHSVV